MSPDLSPNTPITEANAGELLPCPFCGGPAKTFPMNGATEAGCAADFKDCAGSDVVAPVAMWNRRPAASVGGATGGEGERTFGCDDATLASLTLTLEMCERGEGHRPGIVSVSTDTFRDLLAALQPSSAADAKPMAVPWTDAQIVSQLLQEAEREGLLPSTVHRLKIAATRIAQPQPSQQAGTEERAVVLLRRLFDEKRPGYHDCIDAGEMQCAWCDAEEFLAAIQPGEAG